MPYKAIGRHVYVKKGGSWKRHTKKPLKNRFAAARTAAYLNEQTGHGEKKRR